IPLAKADRSRPLPLSLLQRQFWKPGQAAHNARRFTGAFAERIDGRLDLEHFRASVGDVLARHEMLRTRFETIEGEPVQIVEPRYVPELPLLDWSSFADGDERIAALIESENQRVFDLSARPPIAFTLVRTSPEVHWLVISIHHILADHQS